MPYNLQATAFKLRGEGKTYPQIAKELNVHTSTAWWWVKSTNQPDPHPTRPNRVGRAPRAVTEG